ncbi:MAG: hypothetical protein JWO36_794 [Myxococcales bacterium]|nr:hypothetical protein [Myxococcales bacterium]
MPRFTKQAATARIGIGVMEIICARAGQIWRELQVSDVGFDGVIEIVEKGHPTGVLIGVQVKTGASYINRTKNTVTLKADRDHFLYWFRSQIPALGVVVDPSDLAACWLNINVHLTPQRLQSGPYTIGTVRSHGSLFSPDALRGVIRHFVRGYETDAAKAWRTPSVAPPNPRPEPTRSRPLTVAERLAWNRMCDDLLSWTEIPALTRVAHSLGWWIVGAPPELLDTLNAHLKRVSDEHLVRLMSATARPFRANHPEASEVITNVLIRIPRAAARIRRLVVTNALPEQDRECTVQILEMWAEKRLPRLWVYVPKKQCPAG